MTVKRRCWVKSMPFHSLRLLNGRSSRFVVATLLTSSFPVETMELVPDVVVNRCVYAKNEYENYVSRDPTQGKSVPERSYRQIAVCPFRYVGIGVVDEGQ